MDVELNEKGSLAYQNGKLQEAQLLFAKASKVNPKEPKYLSNLSAAQYEAGHYNQAVKSIGKAWLAVNSEQSPQSKSDSLRFKLANRFLKANLHRVANSTASLHITTSSPSQDIVFGTSKDLLRVGQEIDSYVTKSDNEDLCSAWKDWKELQRHCSRHLGAECQREKQEAGKRLRALPIYKACPDPTLEYYSFSHNEVMSLLDKVGDFPAIKLSKLSKQEKRGAISFLFGGSGDARHVFGTLIDIYRQIVPELEEERPVPRFHLTLVDIHPGALARVLLIFELISRIFEEDDLEKEVELEMALFYIYIGIAIPEYSSQIVMDVSKDLLRKLSQNDLEEEDYLPTWLHINESSRKCIAEVLEYWSKPLPKSTRVFLDLHETLGVDRSGEEFFSLPSAVRNKKLDEDPYFDVHSEGTVFDHLKILLPPRHFLDRHPAIAKYVTSYGRTTRKKIDAAKEEVYNTWKPNPTLFDPVSIERPKLAHPGGYPIVSTAPREIMWQIAEFCMRFDLKFSPQYGLTASTFVTTFFRNVANAIHVLDSHEKLVIELVCTDVTAGLPMLLSGDLGERPKEFPITFTRSWNSNVPDYTNGILNAAIFNEPYRPNGKKGSIPSFVTFNCMWNTSAFVSVDEYCYTYSLLESRDIEKYLGYRYNVINDHVFNSHILTPLPLPRPMSLLASKSELHQWLSHLFLCILCNGTPRPPLQRISVPNNLNTFFRLIIYLHNVGFPSHWLADFVQAVVSNNLITNVKPYTGLLPIPLSASNDKTPTPRRVHLKSWQMELETILAVAGPALPFYVSKPKNFVSFEGTRQYRAVVSVLSFPQHPRFHELSPIGSPFIKSVGLIFYKPMDGYGSEELARMIPLIIEGKLNIRSVPHMQIVLGADDINLNEGLIQWRMSRNWYEKMRIEGWEMAAYRSDLKIAISQPSSAYTWADIGLQTSS